MKRINKIFNIIVITIISFIAVIGVASASGVFYYNAVRNQIVFNANISMTGANLSRFVVNTINTDRSSLTISGLQDLQFRFGKLLPSSSFGLNNKDNSRVFQISYDGTLRIGTGLSSTAVGTVKSSIDSTGNFSTAGISKFIGGLVANGTQVNNNKWNEVLKFSGNSASIAWQGLGLNMSSTGFNYGTAANLTKDGNLSVLTKITAPSFCLDGECKNKWSGSEDSLAVVDTNNLATGGLTGSVSTTAKAATMSFGGMYSFFVQWPYGTVGPSNLTNTFDNGYTYNPATGVPTGTNETSLGALDCETGNPANSNTCTCKSGYVNKRFFYRDFKDEIINDCICKDINGGTTSGKCGTTSGTASYTAYDFNIKSCRRLFFFMCTKP